MRLLFITSGLEQGSGGVADYTLLLAHECARLGHDMALLGLCDDRANGILEAPTLLRLGAGLATRERISTARRWIEAFAPDAVSLQFVCFGFHPRGLCWRAADWLRNILGARPVQIMFHELWIGAEQGAYAVLGPFGFGLSALRSRSGANGIHPRVIAATLLGEDTSTASMKRFLDALDDRDPLVRAAAARLLGDYHNKQALEGLSDAIYDAKPAVRFMAAAAYIRAAHPQPENKEVNRTKRIASSTHQHSTTPGQITQ